MIRTLTSTTLLAIGLASISMIGEQAQSPDNMKIMPTPLTGIISDSMCGATHMMKDKPAVECLRVCVKQGSDYALVVGKTVYTLKGNASDLDKYAGERVTVKGTVSGNTITAEAVNPVKSAKK